MTRRAYDRRPAGAPGAALDRRARVRRRRSIVLRSGEFGTEHAGRGARRCSVSPWTAWMLAESDSSLSPEPRRTCSAATAFSWPIAGRRFLVEPVRTVIDFIVRLMRDNAALVRGVPAGKLDDLPSICTSSNWRHASPSNAGRAAFGALLSRAYRQWRRAADLRLAAVPT